MEELWDEIPQEAASPAISSSIASRYKGIRDKIKPPRKYGTLYRIAASLLILLSCTYLAYERWDMIMSYIDPVVYAEHQTRAGEQLVVQLPDGSKVWLNASSRLTYPEKFRGGKREMTLSGEAFFEVRRDESRPFIIHTGDFYTRVLGTSFNIEAYKDDESIGVTVASGKVEVGLFDSLNSQRHELAYLTRDQRIVYTPAKKNMQRDSVAAEQFTAWREGRLIFKRVAFKDLVRTLQRWYAVTIHADGVDEAACTFTADFRSDASLRDVLESFKMTGRIDYHVVNSLEVEIAAKPCAP